MNDFRQPSFYRFNEDSLKLINFVATQIPRADSILDLGAGCGILGIELVNRLKGNELHLVELQEGYRHSLEANIANLLSPKVKAKTFYGPFSQFLPDRQYDLIVSNPPYYLPGHGQECSDRERHLARSFQVDGWPVLLDLAWRSLSPGGRFFLVIKNDDRIIREIDRDGTRFHRSSESMNDLMLLCLSRLNED